MLKRFLIMISLMTAFNLMGQEERENIDTQPITSDIEKCDKDKYGFCKGISYGVGDLDDVYDSTLNEEGMECIEDYTGEETRSSADFEYLYGINLSDLIAEVDYKNTSCSQLTILEEDYQECRIRRIYV